MYYIMCDTTAMLVDEIDESGKLVKRDKKPEHCRVSKDGKKAILDDVQFDSIGISEMVCTIVSHDCALEKMEEPEWKVEEVQ